MADHPLGIAAFIVFYVVFRFAIVKFDLKTPGREDDDEDETKVVLANNDFTAVAKIILEGVGGPQNVSTIDNCITRLRLEIKDYTQVDEKKIKSAGVAGVIRPSKTNVQVIVGTQVQFVADEFKNYVNNIHNKREGAAASSFLTDYIEKPGKYVRIGKKKERIRTCLKDYLAKKKKTISFMHR